MLVLSAVELIFFIVATMVLYFGFVPFDPDSLFFYCYGHHVKHGKPSVLSREDGNMCWKTLRFACRALVNRCS